MPKGVSTMKKNTVPTIEVTNIGVWPTGSDFATVQILPGEMQILFEDGDCHVNFTLEDARRIAQFILEHTGGLTPAALDA